MSLDMCTAQGKKDVFYATQLNKSFLRHAPSRNTLVKERLPTQLSLMTANGLTAMQPVSRLSRQGLTEHASEWSRKAFTVNLFNVKGFDAC